MRFSVLLCMIWAVSLACLAEPENSGRRFDIGYEAVFQDLEPGAEARMWAPLPQSNAVQKVSHLRMSPPLRARLLTDDHGNRLLYMRGKVPQSGTLKLTIEALVQRQEWRGAQPGPKEASRYLQASSLVPVGGQTLRVLGDRELPKDPLPLARALYEAVLSHMNYDKSKPGYGRGDALWACDSKTGNCTDFHSLFLSLARYHKLPARFEIGYPLPSDREEGEIGGYHCWASFLTEGGWIPVDISEADKHPEKAEYFFGNLDPHRVTFSVGRDLVFEPQPSSGSVNYFVKPLLEVEGEKVGEESFRVFFGPPKPRKRRR